MKIAPPIEVVGTNAVKIKDKDGSGEDESSLFQIIVDIGMNGYMVTYEYDDGESERYMFLDFNDALEHIRSNH